MNFLQRFESRYFLAFGLIVTAATSFSQADEPLLRRSSPSEKAETPSASLVDASATTNGESLFDGKTLDGWDGDPRLWSVEDGVIRGETTPEKKAKGNTFLILQRDVPGDFELRLSFRCTNANNSGIQYRSNRITDDSAKNDWVVRGYQHEVRNELGFPNVAGFIYDEGGKRRRICLVGEKAEMRDGEKMVTDTLITEDQFAELFNLDDWNEVVIKTNGRRIMHFLNGTKILDFTDSPELARLDGVIALQLHAGKPMWAEFKDITLKENSESETVSLEPVRVNSDLRK